MEQCACAWVPGMLTVFLVLQRPDSTIAIGTHVGKSEAR